MPTADEIVAHILARRVGTRQGYPASDVELRRLQEIRDEGGMDEAKMWELLRRLRAGEQVPSQR